MNDPTFIDIKGKEDLGLRSITATPTGFLSHHKENGKVSSTYSFISATVSSPNDNDDTLGYDWITSFTPCSDELKFNTEASTATTKSIV